MLSILGICPDFFFYIMAQFQNSSNKKMNEEECNLFLKHGHNCETYPLIYGFVFGEENHNTIFQLIVCGRLCS